MYVCSIPSASSQSRVQRDVTAAAAIVFPVAIYYCWLVSDEGSKLTQLGVICNLFTILFYASPLSTMVSGLCRYLGTS